jgi:hypothetical protein
VPGPHCSEGAPHGGPAPRLKPAPKPGRHFFARRSYQPIGALIHP